MKKTALCLLLALLPVLCPPAAPATGDDYVIGDGDVLRILVYDNPDLSTVSRVSGGAVVFPLIGAVSLAELSVSQAAARIAKLLADGYLVNPQVTVFVEEFSSKKAIIMGQVNSPGVYDLNRPTGLLELISKAGGLSPEAGDKATIKRRLVQDKKEEMLSVNLKRLLEEGDVRLDVRIMDGDSVYVAKAGFFYVNGQVNRPNAYKLEEGATVLQAISLAGGFTNLASKNRVKVIRKADGREQVLERVPMNTLVQAGDVIVVPESFF